jgi:hypothetical protein
MDNMGEDFILAVVVGSGGIRVMSNGGRTAGEIISASGQAVSALSQGALSLTEQMLAEGKITEEMADWYADVFYTAAQSQGDAKMTFGFMDIQPPEEGGEGQGNA